VVLFQKRIDALRHAVFQANQNSWEDVYRITIQGAGRTIVLDTPRREGVWPKLRRGAPQTGTRGQSGQDQDTASASEVAPEGGRFRGLRFISLTPRLKLQREE
jgi:hypothetical protein